MLILGSRLLQTSADARAHYRALWRHIVVDEFQDTNPLQYRFLRLLALPEGDNGSGSSGSSSSVFVVGDANQAIYTWRGADAQNVAKFDRDFNAVMHNLQLNYRSRQPVLNAAMGVIGGEPSSEHAGERLQLTAAGAVAAAPVQPGLPTITIARLSCDRAEAKWVVHKILRLRGSGVCGAADVGILVRTNAQTRSFERELLRQGVPHRLVGNTRFFERKEVRDALAYLRLAANLDDCAACERIINTPPRRIGAKTVAALRATARQRGVPLWEAVAETAGAAGAVAAVASTRVRPAVADFHTLVLGMRAALREAGRQGSPLPDTIRSLLEAAGLEAHLLAQEGGGERVDAVHELLNMAAPYSAGQMSAFLDEVALLSAPELAENAQGNALGVHSATVATEGMVQLMTVHTAKGLEFDSVFVPGFEEELLPHYYSLHPRHKLQLRGTGSGGVGSGGSNVRSAAAIEKERSRAAVAEERRLAFVAITRAKVRCVISHAQRRLVWGHARRAVPSRFLSDVGTQLDANEVEWIDVVHGGGDAWSHTETAPQVHHFDADVQTEGGASRWVTHTHMSMNSGRRTMARAR